MNNKPYLRIEVLTATLVLMAFILLIPSTVLAKGFFTTGPELRQGMLVSLTKNSQVVEASSDSNSKSLLGVVGPITDEVDITPGQKNIITSGTSQALVSTIDGDIKVGDNIRPSRLVGLGSKSDGSSWVVGTAQSSLSSSTEGSVKTTLKDSEGKSHDVVIATIPVIIKVVQESSSVRSDGEQTSWLPNKVQTFANAAAGKKASAVAVIFSFVIILTGLVFASVIANSAIRNGIVSTARQPLAKKAIGGRMSQSILVAVLVLIVSVVSSLVIIRIL